MLVDPEILRAFAGETSRTSDSIADNQLAGDVTAAFAGMPGSTSAWMAKSVEDFVRGLVIGLSDGFDELARSASGAANTFEVTDQGLAASIDRVLPQ